MIAGIAVAATPALASAQLSEQEIRNTVAGKRIYLKVPLGGEFPLYYQTNGSVSGSGDAVGLGRFMQPKDQGRWWVRGDRLCQKWQSWYDGKQFCFTLSRGDGNTLFWRRDDGVTGRARIGQ
ncbi:hypothetical protein GH266_01000 [Stappia indica]|uniref:Uncharacterized protein n=1 Tax=Stappia indica TaxID=538381 RepID=A0A857CE90_9HYPH|nr:hypothetical protein GH266_01000 [Stappia indica]